MEKSANIGGGAGEDDVWLKRLTGIPVADIGDAMDGLGVVDSGIGPMWRGVALVGRALTALTRAGDNLVVNQALDLVRPGMVLVLNGQGGTQRALVGDQLGSKLMKRGAAGIVVDGAVRDVISLERLGLPTFARAITPARPEKHGPGKLNVPVALGGVVVEPGDWIVGDTDGLAVIPYAEVEAVIDRAEQIGRDQATNEER